MGNRACKTLAVGRDASALPAGNEPVAVVTGGGSGIGKCLALHLASSGFLVVIVGRRADILAGVAAEAPEKIYPCPADVATPEGRTCITKFVGDRPVPLLVHNAASCQLVALSTMPLENFHQEMRVNVEAPLYLTQALMANLKKCEDKARVLLVSSGAADMALPTMGCYCMTKAAMKMLWKVLKDELKDDVAVGYCLPGLVQSEITDKQVSDPNFVLKDFIQGRVASGDIHPAKEVAEWMVALLDKKICDDETFVQREHNIDIADHQQGVTVTLTTEAKLIQKASEAA